MKAYVHDPQAFRNHFGAGDTVFQGARRQRGHGAITKFAVPLVSSGIKKASPFLKSFARKTVKTVLPNNAFAQHIADAAVDKVTKTLSSKPMIEKVVGSVEKQGQKLFKKKKRSKPRSRPSKTPKNNVFY